MAYLNVRLIYDGIYAEFDCKIAVMEHLMHEEEMQREVALLLADNPALRTKLRGIETGRSSKKMVRIELQEEDLKVLFDEIVCRDLPKLKARIMKEYLETKEILKKDKSILSFDIVYYVAYGMAENETCREKLEELIINKEEYLSYWEQSDYKNNWVERDVPTKYVWTYRLLIGMIEKIRKEDYRGETYRIFYQILYTGNRYWRKRIKKDAYITGEHIRDVIEPVILKIKNIFSVQCQLILLFLMGDDMGIPVVLDAYLMSFLQLYDTFTETDEEEIEEGVIIEEKKEKAETAVEDTIERTESIQEENNELQQYTNLEEFLNEFDRRHKHHDSVIEMLMSGFDTEQTSSIFYILDMFEIGSRKLKDYSLSKEEYEWLWGAYETWDFKKYGYLMIIAVLCKYICQLEQAYIEYEKDSWKWKRCYEEQERKQIICQKRQEDYEIKRIQAEKKQLEDVILKQELQIAKLEKQLDAAKRQLQDFTQELSALRSYVYLLNQADGEISEEILPDRGEIIEEWKDKKVLVVGGHTNWQSKLREMFPKWQFLTARQSAQIGNVIGGKEIIVCNTAFLDHPSYYKLLSAKDKRQKLCYVHSNNMKKCLEELNGQMK